MRFRSCNPSQTWKAFLQYSPTWKCLHIGGIPENATLNYSFGSRLETRSAMAPPPPSDAINLWSSYELCESQCAFLGMIKEGKMQTPAPDDFECFYYRPVQSRESCKRLVFRSRYKMNSWTGYCCLPAIFLTRPCHFKAAWTGYPSEGKKRIVNEQEKHK